MLFIPDAGNSHEKHIELPLELKRIYTVHFQARAGCDTRQQYKYGASVSVGTRRASDNTTVCEDQADAGKHLEDATCTRYSYCILNVVNIKLK
jgi:hypothetical protein